MDRTSLPPLGAATSPRLYRQSRGQPGALQAGDAGGLDLLRRSYQLRAALGARPQTAAAAATLAAALPPGAEAGQLREAARITATELQLTWLLGSL